MKREETMVLNCTFFGHRNTSAEIKPQLEAKLIALIEQYQVDTFYVGNHGRFDSMVESTLKKLKQRYPHIRYFVVLAYLPIEKTHSAPHDYSVTIYPDGLEHTLPRFAIVKRNRWMVEQCDFVVTYVTHPFGGAAQFKELAEKKGKTVFNLADPT